MVAYGKRYITSVIAAVRFLAHPGAANAPALIPPVIPPHPSLTCNNWLAGFPLP
jgi:hypothetical protein